MRKISVMFLLASSALASSDFVGRFERFCQRSDQGRTNRGFLCGYSPPNFSFGDSYGPGMGAACQEPNWMLQSEGMETATWGEFGTGAAAPTLVANAAVDPWGNTTAERFNFAATTAGQRSIIGQTGFGTCPAFGVMTGSIYIKGVAGVSDSGTLDLCDSFLNTCVLCAYTSTSWSRCAHTAMNFATGHYFQFGNETDLNGGIARPAQSVYLSSAQLNQGATATTYIRTGAATIGQAPLGTNGEQLTYVGTSPSYCVKGNTTASIANGDLIYMPAGQVRVMPDGDGTGGNGLMQEVTATNYLPASQTIGTGVWGKNANITVTSDYAVAPDGTQTADRLQMATTPTYSELYNATTGGAGAGTYRLSIYIKGNNQSGTINLQWFDNTSARTNTRCDYVSNSWTRCSATGTTAGTGNYFILTCGVSGAPTNYCTGTPDVSVWGAQVEAGAALTSYIPTTTVAVVRAAQNMYFDNAVSPWPNLIAGTEALNTTPWSTVSATVTANQGVAPDNTYTAERVQISSCAGTWSMVYQSPTVAGAPMNSIATAYVMGYGGTSGTISLSSSGSVSQQVASCAYNGTTWTRCSLAMSAIGVPSNLIIGCNDQASYVGHTNTGAADVLVWGTQLEYGDTATVYKPRSTISWPGNKDLTAGWAPNRLANPEAMGTSPWATTGTAMTITQDAAAGPNGDITAERFQISACASANTGSIRVQDLTGLTSGVPYTVSLSVKGVSGAGTIGLGIAGSTSGSTTATCAYTNTDWTRCTTTATPVGTTITFAVGCNNYSAYSGATNSGAIDAYFYGAQLEAGSVFTAYTPNGPVAFQSGSMASTIVSQWTSALRPTDKGWMSLNTSAKNFRVMLYNSALGVENRIYVNGASVGGNATVPQGSNRQGAYWGADVVAALINGTAATYGGVSETGATTILAPLDYGSGGAMGNKTLSGTIKNICLSSNPLKCR